MCSGALGRQWIFMKGDKPSLNFATLWILSCLCCLPVELPPYLMLVHKVLDHERNRNDTNIGIGHFHWNNLHFSLVEQGGIRRLADPHCFHFRINEKQGISGTKRQSTKNYLLFQKSFLGGVTFSRNQPFLRFHTLQSSLNASFFYVFEVL